MRLSGSPRPARDRSLAGIAAVRAARPDLPAVACFDTAFHAGLPVAAAAYALPADWVRRHGLRRYGFHGLSHAHVARRVRELLGGRLRVVSCDLGRSCGGRGGLGFLGIVLDVVEAREDAEIAGQVTACSERPTAWRIGPVNCTERAFTRTISCITGQTQRHSETRLSLNRADVPATSRRLPSRWR